MNKTKAAMPDKAGNQPSRHSGAPMMHFANAYGATINSVNANVIDFVGKRMSDNCETAIALAQARTPAEFFQLSNAYWARAGKDLTGLMGAMAGKPQEIREEIEELIEDEATLMAKPNDIFEDAPV